MIRGSHSYHRFVVAQYPGDKDWQIVVYYLTLPQKNRRRASRLAKLQARFQDASAPQVVPDAQKPATGITGRIKGMFRRPTKSST